MSDVSELVELIFARIENIQGDVENAIRKSYDVLDEEGKLTPQNIEEELLKYLWEIADEVKLSHHLLHKLSSDYERGRRVHRREIEMLKDIKLNKETK